MRRWIVAFAAYFWRLHRRWPIPGGAEALRIGRAWLTLTVAFEFTFGRLVAKKSWRELASEYNLAEGRAWPAVLAWLATGPRRSAQASARVGETLIQPHPCGQITARPSRLPLRILS